MFIIIILAIYYYIVKVQFETRFKLSFYGEVPKMEISRYKEIYQLLSLTGH